MIFSKKKNKIHPAFTKKMILDGKKTAEKILESVRPRIEALKKGGIQPKLTIILVGENPASLSYTRQKKIFCESVGITYEQKNLPETVTQEKLISIINEINEDPKVHGLLVQLPLPKHINVPLIFKAINPKKDVDGFTAYNLGKMFLSTEFEHLPPATPKGVISLLNEYGIEIQGKEVVVVGHSNIVGKPLSVMFLNRNATVTTCHYYTKDLKKHTKEADILVVAVGKANLITKDMVKKGAVVVDVGVNRIADPSKKSGYRLVGDVDFEKVSGRASFITPVPGGAGPMTVASLVENLVTAAERLQHSEN